MLVLSRQRDQEIVVGDNVRIMVVDIRGDKVRLGISAPTEVPVHRGEVYDAILREHGHVSGVNAAVTPNRRTEPGHALNVVPLHPIHLLRDAMNRRCRDIREEGGPEHFKQVRIDELTKFVRQLDAIIAERRGS